MQAALETIDGFTQYQGAWQQASWPAGVIVTRSGVVYISLVNGNTEIPTPFAENWSALVEGLAYRGEAPVAATSYSYGQVVLNPDNDNYYFFTSTISASVARADIATHANFHGIVIQATEATKGGVRGATALQAISSSGTDILGWSVNRLGQFVSVVLPAMTQADIDGATMGRKSVTGALIAANAGGSVTELTQAMVEDETDTTFGTVSGERLSQAVAVFATGGGGTASDPVTLLDARAIPSGTAATQVTLAGGSLTDAQVLSFKMIGTSGSIAYVTALAADIRALTVQAAIPTTATTNSLALRITGLNQGPINNSQTNVLRVWYVDDDTLYVAQSRGISNTITITALPVGGGTTGGQQAAAGRVLVQRNIITARSPLSEFSFTTEWDEVDGTQPTFTAIPKADFVQMDLGFYVNSQFVYPITLTRAMATEMGPISNPLTPGLISSSIVPGAFLTFRTATGPDAREPVLLSPKYSYMEARRAASRCGIFVNLNDDSNDDWASVGVHVMCNDQVDWEYARAYYYEDAS